jgi:hypothetical protein
LAPKFAASAALLEHFHLSSTHCSVLLREPAGDAEPMINLFQKLLGEQAYAELPAALRAVHSDTGATVRGHAQIARGRGLLSRICGFAAQLPRASDSAECSVQIVVNEHHETWSRQFAGSVMKSTLSADQGLLVERLGIVRFAFALSADATGVDWRVARAWVASLPMPAAWF